ncbi:MAG: DUF4361 domain-containing protein [Bacteroidales bacterium]|nr:DUF4361 domain-containing protein [Bacteroidales bacterium]
MKYLRLLITASLLTVGLNACDKDNIYERELYKQVIALVCSDDYNKLEDSQLLGEEALRYVAVSCGGTEPVATDVRIALIEDDAKLLDYNWSMYDADRSMYAKRLTFSHYSIKDHHIFIPKGERAGKMEITFYPDGLSPDTAYFLPLSIGAISAYEVNPKKQNVLYRVLIKNQYAEQLSSGYTEYRMNGYKNASSIVFTKIIQPLTSNRVRMLAGDTPFESSENVLNSSAIVLEIQDNRSVRILPYKNITVTQIDDDPLYPNKFSMETDWDKTFKVFRLHYKYKINNEPEVEMREELKFEISEE